MENLLEQYELLLASSALVMSAYKSRTRDSDESLKLKIRYMELFRLRKACKELLAEATNENDLNNLLKERINSLNVERNIYYLHNMQVDEEFRLGVIEQLLALYRALLNNQKIT